MDDRKTVDEVLAALDSSKRDRISLAKDISLEKVPSPSIGLTRDLGGGWVMGREVLIWGPKAAGKSSFCLEQIALLQKLGKVCAYIDAENAFDPDWSTKLGVNNDELIYVDAKTMNHMVDKTIQLIRAGVDYIAIDSITPLVPAAYLEKDGASVKGMADMGALGAHARDLSKALPAIISENKSTLIMFVSQIRMKSMGMHWGAGPTGGTSVDHYMSQIVKLQSSDGESNIIKGEAYQGDRIIEKPIGRKVTYEISKNRSAPPMYSGNYPFYFDGDFVGIDTSTEVLRLAVDSGIIKKAGAWYSDGEKNFAQGEANAAKYLRDNQEFYDRVVNEFGLAR